MGTMLRTQWSASELAKIFEQPPRRVKAILDEPDLIPSTMYRADGEMTPERFVDRIGIVKFAVMNFFSEKLGPNAPLSRQVVRALPEEAAAALEDADLEAVTGEPIIFTLEEEDGEGDEVTIKRKFFTRLARRLEELGLIV